MVQYYSTKFIYCAKFICENYDNWAHLQEDIQELSQNNKSRFQFIYEIDNKHLVIENGIKSSFDYKCEDVNTHSLFQLKNVSKEKFIPTNDFPVKQYFDNEFDRTMYEYQINGIDSISIFFICDVNLTHESQKDQNHIPTNCSENSSHKYKTPREFKIEIKSSNLMEVNDMIEFLGLSF